MSTYVLVLVFMNSYGISAINIDYASKTLCEQQGEKLTQDLPDLKYYCLERK